MYDRHLDSFIVIAESGSFSSAADKLFISRTALIQQMNLLEKELGFHIFERHNKGVTLTPAGEYFYREAKKMIHASNTVLMRCKELEEKSRETIRIGTLPNFTAELLPQICRRFAAQYPNVTLQFIEYPLESYFKNFLNDNFDITTEYMCGYVFEDSRYNFIKLMEDRHCCGMSPKHPLAVKKRITIHDLHGQKIMMYAKGITRADDQLRDYITSVAPDVQIIDIHHYGSSLPLKCELEKQILIYYSMYWKSFPSLASLPMDITMDFPIDIGLGYRVDSNSAVKHFIALAQSMYKFTQ
ncbi:MULTISPECIES: LysR substrate-binding domain-containing protein [unclassified Clostridium]|uniref:LysR substrate-binding domain-containing protein n=1 Tax=unclassified Clostridium TaxID=2614128 RepID=UPI0011071011|nr:MULTISPECIES: LysR substrate-binding domain-containing protein [unclassified Clostridium]